LGVPVGPYLDQIKYQGALAFKNQREALEQAGYDMIEIDLFDDIEEVYEHWATLALGEGAMAHHSRFKAHSDGYSDQLSERIEQGGEITVEELERARIYQNELTENIEAKMEECGADLLICPPAHGPAPEGDGGGDNDMNSPWSTAGLPAMSLPGGTINGLPVGLQVVGATGDDERLLQWAQDLAPVVEGSI
jgi:Asp-tRNA(Asn)/Glu-tRNA(Gln) amidotransferase A subunit family amidase